MIQQMIAILRETIKQKLYKYNNKSKLISIMLKIVTAAADITV
jgi:hypothetical protein